MNKKIIAIAIISMFLLTSSSIVSAETMKEVENIKTTDEPKHEYSWPWYEYTLYSLNDANFEYNPFYLGKIEELWGGLKIGGFFFNVKITGIIFPDTVFLLTPLLRFRVNQHRHLEYLEIEIGDYIEITCKLLSMGYGAGSN